MKVGVCEATELKKRSEMLSIPFADLLWGYAVEDLMLRVSTSAYREFLWLMSLPLLGEEAYRQRAKKRIRFFYKGSEEELTPDKLQPGQRLSIAMGEHIKTTLFAKENAQNVSSCCKPCLRPDFGASSWPRRGFMWTTTRTSRATWPFTSMEASTDGSDRD